MFFLTSFRRQGCPTSAPLQAPRQSKRTHDGGGYPPFRVLSIAAQHRFYADSVSQNRSNGIVDYQAGPAVILGFRFIDKDQIFSVKIID